jgi:hypothetical protein
MLDLTNQAELAHDYIDKLVEHMSLYDFSNYSSHRIDLDYNLRGDEIALSVVVPITESCFGFRNRRPWPTACRAGLPRGRHASALPPLASALASSSCWYAAAVLHFPHSLASPCLLPLASKVSTPPSCRRELHHAQLRNHRIISKSP